MLRVCLLLTAVLVAVSAKPVPPAEPNPAIDMLDKLSYKHYLQQVSELLEKDEGFKKNLEESNATSDDFETGNIAKHLEFVAHNVRTKLDELKRVEVDRLHQVARKEAELRETAEPGTENKRLPDDFFHHLDTKYETFEVEDLRQLIVKVQQDMKSIDHARKEGFKQHELEKQRVFDEEVEKLTPAERLEKVRQHQEQLANHKEHPKVHHPGSKDQFEEVWEEKDHMDKDNFDPKTFFMMHDINGDGAWDIGEIEALFQAELDKVYDEGNDEDDMIEREEEMNRMREHLVTEVDTNKDGLVSFEEYFESTKQKSWEEDKGWDTLDQVTPAYSADELREYEREYQRVHPTPIPPQTPPMGHHYTSESTLLLSRHRHHQWDTIRPLQC